MKKTFTGAVYLHESGVRLAPEQRYYHFSDNDIGGSAFVKVVDCSFDVEIPDDFDPTPAVVAALNEQKRLLRLKLSKELAAIDDRISKLSAICYEPPVTADALDDENIPF
jgi:hypothetical protein